MGGTGIGRTSYMQTQAQTLFNWLLFSMSQQTDGTCGVAMLQCSGQNDNGWISEIFIIFIELSRA